MARRPPFSWRRAALLPAALGGVLISVPARACTITVAGVTFGAYDPQLAAPDDGAGTVDLACHPSVQSPVVSMNAGAYGSMATRKMASGASRLDYNLYTTIARTIVWGDGSQGSATVTMTGGRVNSGVRRFSRTIYGRIPTGQFVPAGTYGDTITVTVTF